MPVKKEGDFMKKLLCLLLAVLMLVTMLLFCACTSRRPSTDEGRDGISTDEITIETEEETDPCSSGDQYAITGLKYHHIDVEDVEFDGVQITKAGPIYGYFTFENQEVYQNWLQTVDETLFTDCAIIDECYYLDFDRWITAMRQKGLPRILYQDTAFTQQNPSLTLYSRGHGNGHHAWLHIGYEDVDAKKVRVTYHLLQEAEIQDWSNRFLIYEIQKHLLPSTMTASYFTLHCQDKDYPATFSCYNNSESADRDRYITIVNVFLEEDGWQLSFRFVGEPQSVYDIQKYFSSVRIE